MSSKTRKKGPTPQGPKANQAKPRKPKAARGTAWSRSKRKTGLGGGTKTIGVVLLGVLALAAIFYFSNKDSTGGTGKAGEFEFVVGQPGPGEKAPPMQLPSTDGSMFDLSQYGGKTVLLYFQEGLMCQPCWDQIKDIEADFAKFEQLGVDQAVTITTDPLDALKQKVADEGLTMPVLADPGGGASGAWGTLGLGMMGGSMNGHSFILVDEKGEILWRADYGAPPKTYMFVPVSNLLADMRAGINDSSS